MNTLNILDSSRHSRAYLPLIICLVILFLSSYFGFLLQSDFGRLEVTNVRIKNYNGLSVRGKLFRPVSQAPGDLLPGIVCVHGYQSCREASDPFAVELARRGFVVLSIDAIGRGNSSVAMNSESPDFDPTFGTGAAFQYLKSIPYVSTNSVGLVGHSLGAEMAYNLALKDTSVKALVIAGFGYRQDASPSLPKNMLMIFGKWDEFRKRMTGTKDFIKEWMTSAPTKKAIFVSDPQFEVTYGNFGDGTARRVSAPRVTHIVEPYNHNVITEILLWMKTALHPPEKFWIDPDLQIVQIKEWCSLLAMLACFASLIPLGLILLRMPLFRSLQTSQTGQYAYTCTGKPFRNFSIMNGILIWLYAPAIIILFAFHKFVVRIDLAFPLMVVNAIVLWFLLSNGIGFFLFRRWLKKQQGNNTLYELGISYYPEKFLLDWKSIGKTLLLALLLFGFAYSAEYVLEYFFLVEFRFIFSFANDLTPYRILMFLQYFPFLLLGFILNGIFLHGQIRRPKRQTWLKTFASSSVINCLVMIIPLILLLSVQYVPLFINGSIPLVGPGGMLVLFIQNIFHIIGVLIIVIPLSTWFYQVTGRIYLGATLNALIVTWMFTATQVIAPIPV